MPEMDKDTPRTNALEARALRLEAKLEKIEALLYEERARQREQQVQIDTIQAGNSRVHNFIGRIVERVLWGIALAVVGLWDKLSQ